MNMKKLLSLLILFMLGFGVGAKAQVMFIPMDNTQSDHLKAYGIAFKALEKGMTVEWLLNYRGGSFILNADDELGGLCILRGSGRKI